MELLFRRPRRVVSRVPPALSHYLFNHAQSPHLAPTTTTAKSDGGRTPVPTCCLRSSREAFVSVPFYPPSASADLWHIFTASALRGLQACCSFFHPSIHFLSPLFCPEVALYKVARPRAGEGGGGEGDDDEGLSGGIIPRKKVWNGEEEGGPNKLPIKWDGVKRREGEEGEAEICLPLADRARAAKVECVVVQNM